MKKTGVLQPHILKMYSDNLRQAMPLYIQKAKNENHASMPDFCFCLLGLPPQTLKTQECLLRPTLLIGAFLHLTSLSLFQKCFKMESSKYERMGAL